MPLLDLEEYEGSKKLIGLTKKLFPRIHPENMAEVYDINTGSLLLHY